MIKPKFQTIGIARWLAVFLLLVTLLISNTLWVPDHGFPLIPAIDWLPVLNDFVSEIILGLMAATLLLLGYRPSVALFVWLSVFFLSLVQTDINRLQPTYFIFMLLLFAHSQKENRTLLLILAMAGIYFWSGAHKVNDYFLEKWLGGLDKRIPFVPGWVRIAFTYAVPAIEAGAGLLLLWVRTRKFASVVLSVMHLIIIATLLKETGGYNVIPLNLLMVATLLLVVYKSPDPIIGKLTVPKVAILVLVWLLPILNIFGRYDHFLSFSIMSGKPQYGKVIFEDDSVLEKIPENAKPYVRSKNGKSYLMFAEWAGVTKKIMVYPEKRVYEKLMDSLLVRASGTEKEKVVLELYKP